MTTANVRERVTRLGSLLAREHESMAEFIAELADFDLRRCWEELGYPSLFEFLVRELHLSRGNGFYRTKAVDLVRRFPEVLEALRDGKLCISCIPEVARVLTLENRADALPRFFHLSREDAKLLAAELIPREVVTLREVVTSVGAERVFGIPAARFPLALAPVAAPAVVPSPTRVQRLNCNDSKVLERTDDAPVLLVPVVGPVEAAEPMTSHLSRLHLTVTRELLAKVEAAQLALSHSRPGATIADLLELGAETALAQDARRKGLVKEPRPPRPTTLPPADTDHIPAEIRRAVWKRDGGCCQWKLANGGVCGSRYRLQFDHIEPKALGGRTTIANVRLLCQRHNLFAARLALGEKLMRRYRRGSAGRTMPPDRAAAAGACGSSELERAARDTGQALDWLAHSAPSPTSRARGP